MCVKELSRICKCYYSKLSVVHHLLCCSIAAQRHAPPSSAALGIAMSLPWRGQKMHMHDALHVAGAEAAAAGAAPCAACGWRTRRTAGTSARTARTTARRSLPSCSTTCRRSPCQAPIYPRTATSLFRCPCSSGRHVPTVACASPQSSAAVAACTHNPPQTHLEAGVP